MTTWKHVDLRYGTGTLAVRVPSSSSIFKSRFPPSTMAPEQLVAAALRRPVGCPPLADFIRGRRPNCVVIVVSDNTRPVPYHTILPQILAEVHAAGIPASKILLLIATGLHRATTRQEKERMFGRHVTETYRIVDHDAQDPRSLREVTVGHQDGRQVRLSRWYLEAGFRIVTGLVEPHFMAGFSGGGKSICPGLCDLESIRRFHGVELLANHRSAPGNVVGNPVFEEEMAVAGMAPPDFSIQLVLGSDRDLVAIFAGTAQQAHNEAVALVSRSSCVALPEPYEVVLTSCGGYPLDATFYQCVKGFVSCLSAVARGGTVIAVGQCSEGIGSTAYENLMKEYNGDWQRFLSDAASPGFFLRDQWQFQMHCRALHKVGLEGVHFFCDGLGKECPRWLCVSGHFGSRPNLETGTERVLSQLAERGLERFAVFPEGPYCAPIGEGDRDVQHRSLTDAPATGS